MDSETVWEYHSSIQFQCARARARACVCVCVQSEPSRLRSGQYKKN